MVGAVAVNNVNLGAAQFQLELLEKQRGDHRHLVLGKIHAGALVHAAAKAHDRKWILPFAALGRPPQRIETLRVGEDIGQEMRVGRVDDHPPAARQLVAAHAQRLFHRAHLQISRRTDASGLVDRPGNIDQLVDFLLIQHLICRQRGIKLRLNPAQSFGVLQQQSDQPGSLPGGGFVPGEEQPGEDADDGRVVHEAAVFERGLQQGGDEVIVAVGVTAARIDQPLEHAADGGFCPVAALELGQRPVRRQERIQGAADIAVQRPELSA